MSSAARLILHTCTLRNAYDGIHCVADLAPDGTLLRSYTWGTGIDNLLAGTLYGGDSTNTLYAVTDPLGTVHALVGTNGVPAVTYAYDSWGNPAADATSASLPNRFTWQGREYSRATALYSFRARWYDPASGRWLSKDPIGLEGGLNLYEAFANNPVCFRDPEGESGENKIDGMNVRVHLNDVDSWPSAPHGDVVGEKLKIDVDGKIWSRQSRKVVGKLSKKGMVKFLKLLTKVTGGVVGFILTPTAMGDGELPIAFRERNARPPTLIVVPPQRDETKPSKNPKQPNSLYLFFAASNRGVKECA